MLKTVNALYKRAKSGNEDAAESFINLLIDKLQSPIQKQVLELFSSNDGSLYDKLDVSPVDVLYIEYIYRVHHSNYTLGDVLEVIFQKAFGLSQIRINGAIRSFITLYQRKHPSATAVEIVRAGKSEGVFFKQHTVYQVNQILKHKTSSFRFSKVA